MPQECLIAFWEETMKITRIDRTQAKHDPSRANYFDGEVNIQSLVSSADSNELDLLNVSFSAGARTRPHIHQQDQVLHIIEGWGGLWPRKPRNRLFQQGT